MDNAEEPARRLDMQPEPISVSTAPSSTEPASITITAGNPQKAIAKRKTSSSQPPPKKARAGPKAPKVRVGPERSNLMKALKKEIRGVKFLATDLSAFADAGDDQWGTAETVRAAAPMQADVARALFQPSAEAAGAEAQAAGGPCWETRLYGDKALRALGVRAATLRGTLYAPPGMQVPARQLRCWAIPRDEIDVLFESVFARMDERAGIPARGPRGGAVAGKPRRIGPTTLIIEELAVSPHLPPPPPAVSASRGSVPAPPLPSGFTVHAALPSEGALTRPPAAQVAYAAGTVSLAARLEPGFRVEERYRSSCDDGGLDSGDDSGGGY
jgi:hypothetical protein